MTLYAAKANSPPSKNKLAKRQILNPQKLKISPKFNKKTSRAGQI
ncbi:hypothetical protein CAMSH0001_1550 [Campylobacter showae RM3277]|uniref:Uncharacterized protein n=1 Tax=Campylobacter showae RM3277 TaxID=553219 RepID=C6RCW4_9BACT|nr:hypothetical protein CAMSH0001_1550 [Campylobacter showae RM3277]